MSGLEKPEIVQRLFKWVEWLIGFEVNSRATHMWAEWDCGAPARVNVFELFFLLFFSEASPAILALRLKPQSLRVSRCGWVWNWVVKSGRTRHSVILSITFLLNSFFLLLSLFCLKFRRRSRAAAVAGPSLQASFCCFFLFDRVFLLFFCVCWREFWYYAMQKRNYVVWNETDQPASVCVTSELKSREPPSARCWEKTTAKLLKRDSTRSSYVEECNICVHAHSQIRHLKLSARERDERRKKVQEVNCRRLPPCAAADDELPPAENVNNINKIKKIL